MHVLSLRRFCTLLLLLAACSAAAGIWHCHKKQTEETSTPSLPNQQVSSDQRLSSDQVAMDRQAFEKAADYAQRITDSVLLIFGGSIVILLGTGYRRPVSRWMRATYLLFPLGWVFLWFSVRDAMKVRGTYIAYLLGPPKDSLGRIDRIQTLNGFALSQTRWLSCGLATFAIWLMIYLCWWISQPNAEVEKENAG